MFISHFTDKGWTVLFCSGHYSEHVAGPWPGDAGRARALAYAKKLREESRSTVPPRIKIQAE